jgi:IS605 OrfB family transposase
MFRTVKVKLQGELQPLYQTAVLYTQACQLSLNYGFEHKTCSKTILSNGTYKLIRTAIPQLPAGLVQTARDQASEMLKKKGFSQLPIRKKLQIRYDRRTFRFYPVSGYVSLNTVVGRLKFRIKLYDHVKQYFGGRYTSSQLIFRKNKVFLNVQYELPSIPSSNGNRVLGIDRGIRNIVTCDDNTFVNSKQLRAVKGRYQYMKTKLQSLGTRSAKRKLRKLAGRERRFTLDVNHRITKWIVQKPYDAFAVEALQVKRRKAQGKRFNKMLGSWSYGQLLRLLEYKAENLGKCVIEVDPRYTSQQCSRCGHIDKKNRKGLGFRCLQCSLELNADLNAARNIGQLGKSKLIRLSVSQPIGSPNTRQIQAIT